MSAPGNGPNTVSDPPGGDRPPWKAQESRELRDLGAETVRLRAEFEHHYTARAFENPLFLRAFFRFARARNLFRIAAAAGPTPEENLQARAEEIERDVTAALEAMDPHSMEGAACPPGLDLFSLLDGALATLRAQKEEADLVAHSEPALRLAAIARELLDDPELSAFRVDLLQQFPSRPDAPDPAPDPAPTPAPTPPGGAGAPQAGGPLRETRFGQYEIQRLLGTGGFAEVYLARHTRLQVPRALKVLKHVSLSGEEHDKAYATFLREAQVQATLEHPNIVRLLEVADDAGRLGLIMDYVDGKNLAQVVHERNSAGEHLPPAEILKIAIDVARGLEHAHARGVVHRDLKPENILVDREGRARIGDFGLARALEETGQKRNTRTGTLVGTPQYMAPEQTATGRVYDPRSDLYSLGAVLYHMAYGEPPFNAEDPWTVLRKQNEEKPEPLSVLLDGFPRELEAIVLRCLEKRPEDRYQDARALLVALQRARVSAESIPAAAPARPARRRNLLSAFALLGAAFLALLVGRTWKEAWTKKPVESTAARPIGGAPASANASAPIPPLREPGPAPEPEKSAPEAKEAPAKVPPPPPPPEPPPAIEKTEKAPVASPPPADRRTQILGYAPTEEEKAFLARIIDLFERRRGDFAGRSYAGAAAELAALKPAGPVELNDYSSIHLAAARGLVRYADAAVRARWNEIAAAKDRITLDLADGRSLSGDIIKAGPDSVVLEEASGGAVTITPAGVAAREFERESTPVEGRLAHGGLSGSALGALRGLLEGDGREKDRDITFWTPLFMRLARLEVADGIGRAAEAIARVRSPDEKAPLPDEVSALVREALASAGIFAGTEAETRKAYPHRGGEYALARREAQALESLAKGEDPSRIISSHAGTRAEVAATAILLGRFERSIGRTAYEELMTGAGFVGWELRPPVKDDKSLYTCIDRDPVEDLILLSSPDDTPRTFLMQSDEPLLSGGVLIRARFDRIGAPDKPAWWRFAVIHARHGSNYLHFDATHVRLVEPFRGEGRSEAYGPPIALPPAREGEKFRVFDIVPAAGGGLHLFADGRHVADFAAADASLPKRLSFTVFQGRLTFRNVKVMARPEEKSEEK